MRAEAVVGKGFPVGEQGGMQRGCKQAHFFLQPQGIRGFCGEHHQGLAPVLAGLCVVGQLQGIGRPLRPGQGVTLAKGQRRNIQGHGGAGF